MSLSGVHLTLLIGPAVPAPAPALLLEALESVEVTHGDKGRSGFQITFRVGRSGPADLLDYRLLSIPGYLCWRLGEILGELRATMS